MSNKRLIVSLAAVAALLAVAGALELALMVFPPEVEADSGSQARREGSAAAESAASVPTAVAERLADVPAEGEARAAELVATGAVVVDGEPLGQSQAESLVAGSQPFVEHVEHIDQSGILPAGCEVVALAVALRAEGFDADPVEIAEGHLDMSGAGERSYGGSPWDYGGGLPPSIVDAGNSWLAAQPGDDAAAAHVADLTGTTFDGVLELVSLGYPVCTWTTENLVEPSFSGEMQAGSRWYYPEHCVVVYGADGDEVLVSDSMAGLVRRDRADFGRIYGECGDLAVLVAPK